MNVPLARLRFSSMYCLGYGMDMCLHRFCTILLDRLTACLFISSDCCFYVQCIHFFSLVKRAEFLAVLLAFVHNLCMISFDCFLLERFLHWVFLYPPFLLLLLCLSIKCRQIGSFFSSSSFSLLLSYTLRCVPHFYCISNVKIHPKSICWLGATLCLVIIWYSVKI